MCYLTARSFEVPESQFVTDMMVSGKDAIHAGETALDVKLVFDKPYFIVPGRKYILRMMHGRPTIWEIEKKPDSMNHIFIREAEQG